MSSLLQRRLEPTLAMVNNIIAIQVISYSMLLMWNALKTSCSQLAYINTEHPEFERGSQAVVKVCIACAGSYLALLLPSPCLHLTLLFLRCSQA